MQSWRKWELVTGMITSIRVVLILVSLNLLSINSCRAENMSHQYNNVPHLFAYKHDDLLNHVKKAGYSDFGLDEITRSSTGTILYLHNFYRTDKSSLILSVSASGEIKKLIPPSRRAYMNDKGEFVVWTDDIKRGIQFKDGKFRSIPVSGYFGVAPGGQFFFAGYTTGVEVINNKTVQVGPIRYFIEIATTDNPDRVLYSTNIGVEKFFSKPVRFISSLVIYVILRDLEIMKNARLYVKYLKGQGQNMCWKKKYTYPALSQVQVHSPS